MQYMTTIDERGKTGLPSWIRVDVGLASPLRVKFLITNHGSASLIASHTYYATQLDRHPQWSQSLIVFHENDPDGVDLNMTFSGTPAGEAFGEAEVPITIPGVNHAIKFKFLLKGNPFSKKSPFVDARDLEDEPVMGIIGMNFLNDDYLHCVMQFGRSNLPPEIDRKSVV